MLVHTMQDVYNFLKQIIYYHYKKKVVSHRFNIICKYFFDGNCYHLISKVFLLELLNILICKHSSSNKNNNKFLHQHKQHRLL